MPDSDPTALDPPAPAVGGAAAADNRAADAVRTADAVRAADGVRTVAAVDLDGVLADVRHRLHHLQRRPKDWESFFAAAPHDPPLAEGFAVARRLSDGNELVYLSGRPERLRRATERWLADHGAPPGRLVLRRDGDRRPARQVKVGELRRIGRSARVVVLVDDDAEVCAAARAAGFTVFHASWAIRDDQDDTAANRTLYEAQEQQGMT